MKRVMVGIAAAAGITAALPATASAQYVSACSGRVGPVVNACVGVDPTAPHVQSVLVYNGNKYLLNVDARTGEVTFCRYTATGSNCYL